MKDLKLYQQINKIREKINKNKLIVFVGSGVSRNVYGMPSWTNIVKSMAEELGYKKCKKCRHKTTNCEEICNFKNEYSNDELLKIPQHLFNHSKEKYDEILSEQVKDVDFDAPLSHLVFDLNPKHIITTNYDRLLERSQHALVGQYKVIVENKDLLNSDENKYIVKMHGCIQNPDSIILKEDDYLDYSQKHILIETFLKSLMVDNTILFLGYSINDYNVKLILSWLNYFKKNKASSVRGRKIGYIVLDDKNLDEVDEKYFANNNIEIIDIHQVKPIENIPNSISADEGKRLFSFLKIISNPHLDVLFDKDVWLSRIISTLDEAEYIHYTDLIKLLYLDKTYNYNVYSCPIKKEGTLIIYQEETYNKLIDIISNSKYSKKIKQLFINAGIGIFKYENLNPQKGKMFESKQFKISDAVEDNLHTRQLFRDWAVCNYKVLNGDYENEHEYFFYRHYVYGYDEKLLKWFYKTDRLKEENDLYVRYLFNKKSLDNATKYIFNNNELRDYIENTNKEIEKIKYRHYSDILNGSREKRFLMNESLNKIKQSSYCNFEELYKLKNYAIDEFKFYFYNNLFFYRFNDLENILKVYIEALVYSCREFKDSSVFNFHNSSLKYALDTMDIIILTAFIRPKELYEIITESGIKKLNINDETKEFIIKSINNNLRFFKTNEIFYESLAQNRIINLLQILQLIDFSSEQKEELANIVSQMLLENNFFVQNFSTQCIDSTLVLKVLICVVNFVDVKNGLEIVRQIISSKLFFEYYKNVGHNFSIFIKSILKSHYKTQKAICDFIDKYKEPKEKIKLLLLFIRVITNKNLKLQYKQFLMDNINQIDENNLIFFSINNWVDIPKEKIKTYFTDIINLDKSQNKVILIPDPYERKVDVICLLYLMGKVDDLSELRNLSKKPSYLEFLIDKDNFDYSKVDFGHYMWCNIIRNEEYRKSLIDNKRSFVGSLKDKYSTKVITEDEKKILYKYFLDENELWSI